MWQYVSHEDRTLIRVTGSDRQDFLQGLITQDITLLSPKRQLLYSAFLTAQGKFLYDFFIWYIDDNTIGLDIYKDSAYEFMMHLTRYKLRKDVNMSIEPLIKYQIFSVEDGAHDLLPSTFNWKPLWVDPRHEALGYQSFSAPDLPQVSMDQWTEHRLKYDVPDCRVDLRNGLSSPFEGNIDLLNGIAFDKGCYMGQELVSRIHHRGLVKRRFPNL